MKSSLSQYKFSFRFGDVFFPSLGKGLPVTWKRHLLTGDTYVNKYYNCGRWCSCRQWPPLLGSTFKMVTNWWSRMFPINLHEEPKCHLWTNLCSHNHHHCHHHLIHHYLQLQSNLYSNGAIAETFYGYIFVVTKTTKMYRLAPVAMKSYINVTISLIKFSYQLSIQRVVHDSYD